MPHDKGSPDVSRERVIIVLTRRTAVLILLVQRLTIIAAAMASASGNVARACIFRGNAIHGHAHAFRLSPQPVLNLVTYTSYVDRIHFLVPVVSEQIYRQYMQHMQ